MNRWNLSFALIVAAVLLADAAPAAPVSYLGGVYTQDFNGLPTNVTNPAQTFKNTATNGPFEATAITGASNVSGWQIGNYGGSSADTEFRSQDGSLSGSTGRGVLSLGTNGSTDRALGALSTSNQIVSFGLAITNNTATTFDHFSLSFVTEQWRRGDVSTAEKLNFSYGIGTGVNSPGLTSYTALNAVSPNTQLSPTNVALDGNLAGNQAIVSSNVAFLWAPGQTLILKWTPDELSGQDDALGIDNLAFSATAVPEPSTICLATLGLLGVLACRIRRKQ